MPASSLPGLHLGRLLIVTFVTFGFVVEFRDFVNFGYPFVRRLVIPVTKSRSVKFLFFFADVYILHFEVTRRVLFDGLV